MLSTFRNRLPSTVVSSETEGHAFLRILSIRVDLVEEFGVLHLESTIHNGYHTAKSRGTSWARITGFSSTAPLPVNTS